MKINDIVELRDGSWNMSLIKGVMEHIFGILHQHRRYRVLGIKGAYPTNRSHVNSGTNDAMLVDVNDPDFVLFTQERFCRVVVSVPPPQLKIVVPRGTEGVYLILG